MVTRIKKYPPTRFFCDFPGTLRIASPCICEFFYPEQRLAIRDTSGSKGTYPRPSQPPYLVRQHPPSHATCIRRAYRCARSARRARLARSLIYIRLGADARVTVRDAAVQSVKTLAFLSPPSDMPGDGRRCASRSDI